MADVKSGVDTTEKHEADSAKVWGIVGLILGFITTSVSPVLVSLGVTESSTAGIIAGALISCASLAYRTFVSLGYIKSRTDVKVSANANSPE